MAMDGELKHHRKYIKKLILVASALGLKVSRGEECEYLSYERKIILERDMAEDEEIASLLHELGHALDDILNSSFDTYYMSTAYYNMYNGVVTKKQRASVYVTEKRAWYYGERLAKKLGIRLGKWYFRIAKDSLKSYRYS